MNLTFKTKYLTRFLICVCAIAVGLNLLMIALRFTGFLTHPFGWKLFFKLYIDGKANLPSYVNTLLLFIASLFLGVAHVLERGVDRARSVNWLVLSIIFLFLSLDESIALHDFVVSGLPRHEVTYGQLFIAWFVPYGIAAGAFSLYQLRFLTKLDSQIAFGFFCAALVYLGGAVGAEWMGSKVADSFGTRSLAYALTVTVEESLEMGGLVTFIHFMSRYMSRTFGTFTVKLA